VLSFDARAVRKLLPQRYPFMMLDRIQAYDAAASKLTGVKYISRNDPFLPGHFPEYPIFPGVLILESLVQASACLALFHDLREQGASTERLEDRVDGLAPVRSLLAESKMRHLRPVFPGVQMELESQMIRKSGDRYCFRSSAWVDGEEVSKGQITLARSLESAPTEVMQPLEPPLLSFDARAIHRMLPLRNPFVFLDRVESYSIPEKKVIGIREVTRNEPVLAGHFPEEAIFPGSLVIESLAQSCGFIVVLEHLLERVPQPERLYDEGCLRSLLPGPPAVLADSKIEQLARVYPGNQMKLEAQLITRRTEVHYFQVRALVQNAPVASGTIMLALTTRTP
jgi:3-hydroxyacyl-[acyl-carrier-protein] dehydratase